MLARRGGAPLVFMYICCWYHGIHSWTQKYARSIRVYIVDKVYGVQSITIADSGVITSTCGKVLGAMYSSTDVLYHTSTVAGAIGACFFTNSNEQTLERSDSEAMKSLRI